ncbi:hypothetical protein ACFL12_06910 [Pseudomonadota bacterium]
MGKVVTFLGWLLLSIAGTLYIFSHISMLFVYNIDYLLDTLWPSDPEAVSSLWFGLLVLVPGTLMLGFGKLLEKYASPEDEDAPQAKADPEEVQD